MKKSSFRGEKPPPGTVEEDLVLGKKNFLKLNPARSYGKSEVNLGTLNSPDFGLGARKKSHGDLALPMHSICGSPA